MRIDWACAPFAVRLPPPQVLRLTTAMRMSCSARDSWWPRRPMDCTVEEHKEVVPIASQMFRESLVGRIGESAVQQAVHLRLEESLGNVRIPGQRDRRFRRKAIRDSEPRRSLIPGIPIALLCRELSLIDSTILRQSRSSQGGRPRDGS